MQKIEIVKTPKGAHLEIDKNRVDGVYSIEVGNFNGHKDLTIKILSDDVTWRFENE